MTYPSHGLHERARQRVLRLLSKLGADGCTVDALRTIHDVDLQVVDDLYGCGLVELHHRRQAGSLAGTGVLWAVITADGREAEGNMPKIWVTVDHVDGRSAVKGPYYPDEIQLTGLLMRLNEADLAGVTFTNAEPLRSLIRKGEKT